MSVEPTFHGYVETTSDALLLFEACKRGILPKVSRRLQERERSTIVSGAIFIFDERESGIRRWTDGMVWSPSRILNNFLVYRELDRRQDDDRGSSKSRQEVLGRASGIKDADAADRIDRSSESHTGGAGPQASPRSPIKVPVDRQKERSLVGSLTSDTKFKANGLVKKTMSVNIEGTTQHLISYYTLEDAASNVLQGPTLRDEIKDLEISPEFLHKTNFRVPLHVENGDYDYGIEHSGFSGAHSSASHFGMGLTSLGLHGVSNPYDNLSHHGPYMAAGFPAFAPVFEAESHFGVAGGSAHPSGIVSPFVGGHATQVIPQRANQAFTFSEASYLPLGNAHVASDVSAGRTTGPLPPGRQPVTFVRRSATSHQRHRSHHSGSFSSSTASGHSRKSSLASPSMSVSPAEYRLSYNANASPSAASLSSYRPTQGHLGFHPSSHDLTGTLPHTYTLPLGFSGTGADVEALSVSETQSGPSARVTTSDLNALGIRSSLTSTPTKGLKRERTDDLTFGEAADASTRRASASPSAPRLTTTGTAASSSSSRRNHTKSASSLSTISSSPSDSPKDKPIPVSMVPSSTIPALGQAVLSAAASGAVIGGNGPTFPETRALESNFGSYEPQATYKPHAGDPDVSWSELYHATNRDR